MRNFRYLFKRILEMDYKALFSTVGRLHEKTGRSRLWLFYDIVKCGVRYGAGYRDYELCEFYNLTPQQRATYVTRGVNNRLVKLLDDPAYDHCFENKADFCSIFSDFLKRDILDFRSASLADFTGFMQNKEEVVAKPLEGSCGQGVEKLRKADYENLSKMYDYLKSRDTGVLEQVIIPHPVLESLYPYAINTYRIVTVFTKGEPHIVYAFIRIGNGGEVVDNINSGGMAAPVDLLTGVVKYCGYDKDGNSYEVHPMTGSQITGLKLPFWDESMQICLKAARVVPQTGYVGWDVAVTPDEPLLVEGNIFPGHDILQMPPHVPDKIGMLPRFREFVEGI